MFIWAIVIFTALFIIMIFARLRLFIKTDKRNRIGDIVRWFARKAENQEGGARLKYTGPHEINTALVGICFTISGADNLSRLSVNLNANCRKPWWVLYEEFKKDETSGQKIRTECHEAEFDAKSEVAVWLETLRKTAFEALLPVSAPATFEPKVDPFEPLPDKPKPTRNS